VIIQIDTSQPLTDLERDIAMMALGLADGAKAPAAKAPAAKKAAAPAPADLTPDAEASKVASPPAEAPDADALDAAVARASDLLSNGERERVMAALKEAGAARVSEIPSSKVGAFLAALAD
jgi:hypothetical protein